MENKKPLSTFREVHQKVQEALSHAREVREKDAVGYVLFEILKPIASLETFAQARSPVNERYRLW